MGRRRFPTYWIHGSKVLVRTPQGGVKEEDVDRAEMALEEGRRAWSRNLPNEEIVSVGPEERDVPARTDDIRNGSSNGGWTEKGQANKAS